MDTQISEEFAEANDLVRYRDESGNIRGGFFEANRRVRTQKFRGAKSEGFWCPLSYLDYLHIDISSIIETFEEKGEYTFTTLYGKSICNKYYTPATLRAIKNKNNTKNIKRGETLYFPKHIKDTIQLRHILDNVPHPSLIYITEKLHGTSQRMGYVLDDVYLPWWKQYLNKVHSFFPEYSYTTLIGTRNVILQKTTGSGYYGSHSFRYALAGGLILKKGEILYGEVVGYVHGNTPIMPSQKIEKSEVKELVPIYGDTMRFTYGCKEGESKFYVYRIIHMGEDGHYVELSWPQVKKRCRELGILHVPDVLESPLLYSGKNEELAILSEQLNQGNSLLDSSHMREGIVLRIEYDGNVMFVKDKSFHFKILEGIIKSQDDYVDIEEEETFDKDIDFE